MHVCYVDDSGRDKVVTITGLLVPTASWNDLLHLWLSGRRKLTDEWGVRKHVELHANKFTKAKGAYCETPEQERTFRNETVRARACDILLREIGGCEALTVTTIAAKTDNSAVAYAAFINHLEAWAAVNDTQILVILDGQEGPIDNAGLCSCQIGAAREVAYRNAVHYRNVHRGLELKGRRVIEDPIMHDSKWSQLVQAADLVAYATYQHLWHTGQHWPAGGPKHGMPNQTLATSYQRRLAARWLPDSDHGIHWAAHDEA